MISSLCFLFFLAQLVAPAWASIRSVGLRGDRPWHPRLQRARLPDGSATLVKIATHDSEEDGGDLEPPSLLQVQSSSSESNCPCPKKEGVAAAPMQNAVPVQPVVQEPASQSFIETAGSVKVQQIPAPHAFTQVQQQVAQQQQQPQVQMASPGANPFAPVNADFGREGQTARSLPVNFQQTSIDASQPPGTATIRLTAVNQQAPQNFQQQQQQVSALQQEMQAEQMQLQNQMLYLQKMQQVQQETSQMQQMQPMAQPMQQMPQMPMSEQIPQQMPVALPQVPQQMMQMPQQLQQQMPQQMMQQMPQQMAFAQMPQQVPQMMQQMQQVPQMMQQMQQQMPQQMPSMGQIQPMVFMEGVPPVQQQEPARMQMVQYPMQYPMQYMR